MQEPYFQKYLRLVDPRVSVREQLILQRDRLDDWASKVDSKATVVMHGPYTWTLKEVLKHLSDCERVFAFRALWIARGETESLDSFDEKRFLENSGLDGVCWDDLVEEFFGVRNATLSLLRGMPEVAWGRQGVAAGYEVDVKMLFGMIFGHVEHHFSIMRSRVA